MTRFGLAFVLVFLPLALCAGREKEPNKDEAKDEKKGFVLSPKGGKFSVSMPEKPTETTSKSKAAGTDLETHMFTLSQKDRAFYVAFNDYPAGSVDADADKVLTAVIDGVAKSLKGKVAVNEKVKVGKKDNPGRDVRIEYGGDKKLVYRGRVCLVGNRLYQVVALGPDEFTKGKVVDEYFKSFALEE